MIRLGGLSRTATAYLVVHALSSIFEEYTTILCKMSSDIDLLCLTCAGLSRVATLTSGITNLFQDVYTEAALRRGPIFLIYVEVSCLDMWE